MPSNDKLGVCVANRTLSTITQNTAQLIQSYPGTIPNFSISEGDYCHGVKYSEIRKMPKSEIVEMPIVNLVKIVQNLITSSKSIGYNSIVVLFDQIDEVSNNNSDIEKVADFMVSLLSDTNFLYMKDLSIVISLWSEVKNKLNNKNIRFDKFKEIDIRWRNEELIKLMDKRLRFYSIDKEHPVTLSTLIPEQRYREIILNLAGGSPRALITLMSYIISEEQSNNQISEFSVEAITKGCMAFCKKYDYVSLQPSRIGKGNDLKAWIVKILRMRLSSFNVQQYGDFYNLTPKTAIKHIDQMIKLNLIKDALLPSEDDKPVYEVVDPRILHMIGRGVLDLD